MEESLIRQYNGLSLAYLGDSVLDLMVKDRIVRSCRMQPKEYHKKVSLIVCAKNQSLYIDKYLDDFSEEEKDIYLRGRNSNVYTKAKNASLAEYKQATGFEAVIGYLYLKKDQKRLEEIVNVLYELGDNSEI